MPPASSNELINNLLDRYGPTLGGRDLYAALGFKSYAAFYRSKQRGEVGIDVFTLPGRRGWFAFTTEVAAWLIDQAHSGTHERTEET